MNNRLVKVCEDILNDENEFKKFFGIKTLGGIYDYLKNKVPDLSSDEFGYFVARVLEEYEKQKGDSNVINLEKLEKIAGGKGFGKRLASGGLALASLLTSQPSLHAAKADSAVHATDSYLSGKELSAKDSKDRSERSEGNSSSALGYVATLLGGAVVGAAAVACAAYKYWPSSNSGAFGDLSGNFDPYTMFFELFDVREGFLQAVFCNNLGYIDRLPWSGVELCDFYKDYVDGLGFAIACGKYEFVDAFMDKFISELHLTESQDFLKNALLFYIFFYSCLHYSEQIWSLYACKNLISHYNLFKAGDDCRKIDLDTYGGIASASISLEPLSLDEIIDSLINSNNMAVLRMLFEAGVVKPTDCLKYVDQSRKEFAEANFVRLVRDMDLANLNDKGIYDELIKILQANEANIRDLPIFVQLYPQVLDWWFDDEGNHVAAGTSKSHHLLMYAILRHSWNCAFVLADNEILPNWWSITDNKSKSPFEYINFLLSRDSHKSAEIDMKQFYCALWDKAVAQGAQLDQTLSPETLRYRPAPASHPYGGDRSLL